MYRPCSALSAPTRNRRTPTYLLSEPRARHRMEKGEQRMASTRTGLSVRPSLRCLRQGGSPVGLPYRSSTRANRKVLDFIKSGGPKLTVDRTVFELWMGL